MHRINLIRGLHIHWGKIKHTTIEGSKYYIEFILCRIRPYKMLEQYYGLTPIDNIKTIRIPISTRGK